MLRVALSDEFYGLQQYVITVHSSNWRVRHRHFKGCQISCPRGHYPLEAVKSVESSPLMGVTPGLNFFLPPF